MKVKEVAELVGISVRTLHYYDEIGLLKPDNITESGYRLYSERNLEQLQQILFFRELGFPLKEIRMMMENPAFSQFEALQMHKKVLLKKREHLDILIKTIDKTIAFSKGEIEMTKEERFAGFNFDQDEFEQEARERWGDEAIDASKAKIANLSKNEKRNMEEAFEEVYTKLAEVRYFPAESVEAQQAIEEWWVYLNKIGNYTLEAFKGLGEMYISDERFTKNIDAYGEGLAQFMCDAMRVFAENNK
ncbi:MerR family transcriptional regulator [Pseudogracilibacillus auburnensis]|uniref:MerR family transcriptional regulator n=1 Tax=Pseudogracilibacillus auburnensis TaxID=1494959 RepID=UPI001A96D1F5|nr:MerR family transcriptional regulator [Pseudogracilibacillus auburnensis]MBO1004644.1 MerR family transcriptional regulator [Pseudogracilibacillus auburnensis]